MSQHDEKDFSSAEVSGTIPSYLIPIHMSIDQNLTFQFHSPPLPLHHSISKSGPKADSNTKEHNYKYKLNDKTLRKLPLPESCLSSYLMTDERFERVAMGLEVWRGERER